MTPPSPDARQANELWVAAVAPRVSDVDVLTLRLPLMEEPKPRRIEISRGEGDAKDVTG
ncbi:Hsp20/alpha crystallin family protein [Streptomyces zaehneri]|uniref:hypothetical protein n=1 Tax=Streptomyces zaehneri TaxID=3051180 RepID=UPI0028D4599A|nr:hypothetical protein [Streptomyces sp. DSM 40713]